MSPKEKAAAERRKNAAKKISNLDRMEPSFCFKISAEIKALLADKTANICNKHDEAKKELEKERAAAKEDYEKYYNPDGTRKDYGSNEDADKAKKRLEDAENALSNLNFAKEHCICLGGGGGGGSDKGSESDIVSPGVEATLPVVTIPQEPTPSAPEYQYAACDYTSPDYNNMHKCVLKEEFEPGDILCDVSQNKIVMVDPATMDQQKQQNFISKFTS